MTTTQHHADGSIAATHEAISRQKMPEPDWNPNTWAINLDNGKRIISSDEHLDSCYHGWRELEDITP